MAMASGIGAKVDALPAGPAHAVLFGEDQGRYLLSLPADAAEAVVAEAKAAGVPAEIIGKTGGSELALPGEAAVSIAALRKTHESWLPDYMAGKAA
jgi:phosphoribosylformylglycinamidine (FGAM) synthase-like enzyme